MSTKEKVIKYLLSLNREYVNSSAKVYVSDDTYNDAPIDEINSVELLENLLVLESEGLLKLRFGAGRKVLSHGVDIFLTQNLIHYFDIKEQQRKSKNKEIRKEIRAWITLVIAIAGFVLSVISLYLDTLPPK